MALIDIHCLTCGGVREVYRAAADWPATPPCESCNGATEQIHLPKRVQWTPDAVVVYRTPEGDYRFPADGNGLSAQHYQKLGYERVELRGFADVRRFEKDVNQRESIDNARRVESQCREHEEGVHLRRKELFHQMSSMSAKGRAVARAAIERNNAKPGPRTRESGFYVEAYSEDRGSREAARDPQGRRRRD